MSSSILKDLNNSVLDVLLAVGEGLFYSVPRDSAEYVGTLTSDDVDLGADLKLNVDHKLSDRNQPMMYTIIDSPSYSSNDVYSRILDEAIAKGLVVDNLQPTLHPSVKIEDVKSEVERRREAARDAGLFVPSERWTDTAPLWALRQAKNLKDYNVPDSTILVRLDEGDVEILTLGLRIRKLSRPIVFTQSRYVSSWEAASKETPWLPSPRTALMYDPENGSGPEWRKWVSDNWHIPLNSAALKPSMKEYLRLYLMPALIEVAVLGKSRVRGDLMTPSYVAAACAEEFVNNVNTRASWININLDARLSIPDTDFARAVAITDVEAFPRPKYAWPQSVPHVFPVRKNGYVFIEDDRAYISELVKRGVPPEECLAWIEKWTKESAMTLLDGGISLEQANHGHRTLREAGLKPNPGWAEFLVEIISAGVPSNWWINIALDKFGEN